MNQLDVLRVEVNVICSSLPGIPIISTSSTIAPTLKIDVVVPELTPSEDVAGKIGALFGLTESETIGGIISQYISINRNGTTSTLRSESPVGSEVVKLEVYPLKEIIGLQKESWWKKATMRLYNAPNGEVSDYYYTLEESLLITEKVIMYQCWDNKDKFIQFLMDCISICDKLKPKINCLFIQSDPNADKNFIMDSILHYYFNFGLVDKRILMLNEPSCEPSAFETLKMLFGGDNFNVKIKCESDTVLLRTPIIILSNNDPFPRDEAFRSRMIYYKWRTCPMLKDYKKILPLTFYLLEIHDIFNTVDAYIANDDIVNSLLINDFNCINNIHDDIFNLDDLFNE
ncbi:hypothetical protein FQA39_LY15951 [Lamprigera yunnana]|nr:hypothetical protein FQA39_LY15951 [Lamprigera yunnana]